MVLLDNGGGHKALTVSERRRLTTATNRLYDAPDSTRDSLLGFNWNSVTGAPEVRDIQCNHYASSIASLGTSRKRSAVSRIHRAPHVWSVDAMDSDVTNRVGDPISTLEDWRLGAWTRLSNGPAR